MAEHFVTITPEHQSIMDEDHDRKVEALLQEGLKMRALCERVLSPADGADSQEADTALMAGADGEWCPCAVARRVLVALNAERREGRRDALAWTPGAPPGAGHYWIQWQTSTGVSVHAVNIGPAILKPEGRLLLKFGEGDAYVYEPNREKITHHMPIAAPPAPSEAAHG